ncbi:protein sidekick-2-like [Anopheles arabiensis]|uniref:Putative receptor-type tyrosine-protein phosphatase mosPTP-1 n=1 Tax=Anopheles coluzzii TaxID=1518534 RepID=A0A6E8V4Z9_ANOCL|nr:protein sidekick-2-like [Anopheles arabiensis]XP_040154810.1 protein sidekick-2-like [Anopheles arabiensis]XP_040154811.1 protein sidekick-2-like [Anopheles arabiensis]XP_040154812.1 protein sidekick-2-like [Anopheles arabiensis]XP_040154813.1 protein sidekick-2-like [Anopheles arabiensis]XP_040154814.1 protein sidekick-2-like [Anopheles arabiensis]XP_040154815.1 protein sidekick-2-like [Anopheles arabiensis]XP_040154816.1 protein sidekick-2-like [Anopheles arabiensis]XP_040154817.1 prot
MTNLVNTNLGFIVYGLIFASFYGSATRIFDIENIPVVKYVAVAGRNVTISCPGVNEHSLIDTLIWKTTQTVAEYVNGSPLVNNPRITLLPGNFSLHISPTSSADTAEYTCLFNDRHSPEAIADLLVQDVPDPPGRPLVVSFTSRSVDLSWAHSQDARNAPVTNFIIETRVGENGDWNQVPPIYTKSHLTTYQVTELLPFTVYSFRIIAVNELGHSTPSKESYYFVTLREAPTGKPVTTIAHNTSATSVYISWKPPPPDTILGEFLGYRITYRTRDRHPDDVKEIYIRDSTVESHEIHNLETYTQYLVSIQVFNPEGLGPPTTVLVMTDEGVPTKPRNLSVLEITSTTIRISWLEPEKRNGVIHGYRVYYVYQNQTLLHLPILKNDAAQNSVFYYTLTNLKPFTDYRIIVTAFTLKYDGEPSEVSLRTDVGGPSPPKVLNLTCHSLDTLFFSWRIPRVYHSSIDFYIVNYRNLEYDDTHEIRISANASIVETSMVIPNLTTNSAYEVKVRGATVSTVNPKKVVLGTYCEPIKIALRANCEQYQPPPLRHNPYVDQELVILAGIVIGCFGLLLIILAIVLWRKCFHASYHEAGDQRPSERTDHKPTVQSNGWKTSCDSNGIVQTSIPSEEYINGQQQAMIDRFHR